MHKVCKMPLGGRREGAGRKALAPQDKKVQTTITIARETKDILDNLRKKNIKIGPHIDSLALELKERFLDV